MRFSHKIGFSIVFNCCANEQQYTESLLLVPLLYDTKYWADFADLSLNYVAFFKISTLLCFTSFPPAVLLSVNFCRPPIRHSSLPIDVFHEAHHIYSCYRVGCNMAPRGYMMTRVNKHRENQSKIRPLSYEWHQMKTTFPIDSQRLVRRNQKKHTNTHSTHPLKCKTNLSTVFAATT